MSKSFLYKLLIGLVIAADAVLWLLSLIIPNTFGWFNSSYAVAVATGGIGVLLLLKGAFTKSGVTYKSANIWLGVGLLVVTVFALVSAIAIPKNIVAPIIACVLAAGIIITILVTGGKNWDEGDNQKVGYKTYKQRKAEEEKQEKKDNK